MTTLTVTSRGQVTLRKEVLAHLGVKPGERIEVDLLPGGRVQVSAARPMGTVAQLAGMLAGRTNGRTLTLDELNNAIAEAGAAAGRGE